MATLGHARHALRIWSQKKQLRTLAFCVSRKHADFMAAEFKKSGVQAESVHGESEMSRGEALEKLEAGELEVVFSVDFFNEGVDLPAIDTVLLLRPTESKVLFLQQIGRGLRKNPGKEKLVVLDFVGNHQSFLHKPQALMGQSMNFRQLAEFSRRAEKGDLELPDGCFVNYDLEIINFLKGLDQKGSEKDYQMLKNTLGRRPTLTEYYHFGANIKKARKQYGSWFDFVMYMGDLEDAEAKLLEENKGFLIEVETTSMTKSFKMILLEAFQSLGGWKNGVDLKDLANESWKALRRRPNFYQEISESARALSGDSKEWQRYWKKNPVDHWTNKSPELFLLEDGKFSSSFLIDSEESYVFSQMVQETIDYRLASYEARLDSKHVVTPTADVIPMTSESTELPFFPTLKIACGHFRNSSVDVEEYRSLGAGYGSLDAERHFIARASGNSMDGGKSPIQDGDYLLLEIIGSSAAGKITDQNIAIERVDEFGDTQYLLRTVRKSPTGSYVLKAANPEYDDLVVTPELEGQLRTFARLKYVIDPLEMLRGQELLRENIPELFGAVINPGNWQSGHVFLQDPGVHVLLVTLNKQGASEQHRYVDHWIDEKTFHWQSQNSTTPSNKRGRELINHKSLGLAVHLFVRENKLRNGKAAPFTYYGEVEYQSHTGSAPISVVFKINE